jgi:hypothetical protein
MARLLIKIVLAVSLVCGLEGCGGGSEGTGTRTIVGRVTTGSGEAVAGATITVLETSESAVTDDMGQYFLRSELPTEGFQLEVSTPDFSATTGVAPVDDEVTQVVVDITLEPETQTASVSNVNTWGRIEGECEKFFDNDEIIRQSTEVEGPIACTFKFFVSGDGLPLSRARGVVQVRACDSEIWFTIAEGRTGTRKEIGVGQIEFTFQDDFEHCEYRLVAPFETPGLPQGFISLQTLTLQEIVAGQAH